MSAVINKKSIVFVEILLAGKFFNYAVERKIAETFN